MDAILSGGCGRPQPPIRAVDPSAVPVLKRLDLPGDVVARKARDTASPASLSTTSLRRGPLRRRRLAETEPGILAILVALPLAARAAVAASRM